MQKMTLHPSIPVTSTYCPKVIYVHPKVSYSRKLSEHKTVCLAPKARQSLVHPHHHEYHYLWFPVLHRQS
ncbi:hypothetical protein ACHAXS_001600 [Conticribra weissflogii]